MRSPFLYILCMATGSILLSTGCAENTDSKDNTVVADSAAAHDYAALRAQVDSIAKGIDGKVSVAVVHIEKGDTFSYNGTDHKPMMSTCKFPLALMVLDMVDSGKLTMEQTLKLEKKDMKENTHSPLRDSLKGKPAELSIHDLLYFSVAVSDNITTDLLLKHTGGPEKVTAYANRKGMKGINMVHTEGEMALDWMRPYDNWCEPKDMAMLVARFYKGELLSKTSTDTLRQIMERTTGGPDRIKGMLPQGTIVAHKTGTGNAANGSLAMAVNDIGIITMPDGSHIALAVYVSDAKTESPACEKIIAQIAKAVYDDALKK